MVGRSSLACSYVLPIKARAASRELTDYVTNLSAIVPDVIVVDGSEDAVFAEHRRCLPPNVRHVRPDPSRATAMGKVAGVLTGLDLARHEAVVIADDDVRWSPELLEAAISRLASSDVVRPQNAFDPCPWHAWWDTGRILVNRALGGDWPGTLVVRRSSLSEGYSGDALFENLELVRTVRAGGGREVVALDLIVPRVPPSTSGFWEQRVRQAYDEWARPWRLVAQLALLPLAALGGWRRIGWLAASAALIAEVGRRREGGSRTWPAWASLWAPVWVAERSLTSWLAVLARVRGGARYRDGRLPTAAHSIRWLRRQRFGQVRR